MPARTRSRGRPRNRTRNGAPRDNFVAQRLVTCISDDTTCEHRIAAALTLLKFADITGQPDLIPQAKLAVDSTESRSGDELARLECELIYCSIVGNSSKVGTISDALDAATVHLAGATRRRHLRNASVALIRTG